jgi:hypothetical protein
MMVSPVFVSRAIFDQSLQGSPTDGAFAAAEVVVVMVGGIVAVGGGGTTGGGVGEVDFVGCIVVAAVVDGGMAVWWLRDNWMPTKMSVPVSKNAATAAIVFADRAHDNLATRADTGEVFGDPASGDGAVTPASSRSLKIPSPSRPNLAASRFVTGEDGTVSQWHTANRTKAFAPT